MWRRLSFAPLPLVGRGRGWGSANGALPCHNLPTPHPDPPPQGGEGEESATPHAIDLHTSGGGKGGGIRDGDVFVSNHPYEGGLPHVSDMAFVAPVFAGEKIVAFAGSIAH